MSEQRSVILTAPALAKLRRRLLSSHEQLVLWYLVQTLPPGGAVLVISDIASEVGLPPPHFNVALRELCKAGFVLRGDKVARSWHYRLNPGSIRLLQA